MLKKIHKKPALLPFRHVSFSNFTRRTGVSVYSFFFFQAKKKSHKIHKVKRHT